MSIKSILIPFSGDKKETSALDTAFALGKDFASHITCLHTSPDPKHIAYGGGFGVAGVALENMAGDIEAANQNHADATEQLFKEYEKKNHIVDDNGKMTPLHASAQFRYEVGNAHNILTHYGRLSDLIVMGRTMHDINPDYAEIAKSALFETGKPVLFTPPKTTKTVGYNIAIAWNGSAESARAVGFSLPFLRQARNVHIFTIKEKDKQSATSVKEFTDYLALHDINAKSVVIDKRHHSIGETILHQADTLEIDLLVMGAYTHHRVRQMIVGGATSHILSHASIPVLMSH